MRRRTLAIVALLALAAGTAWAVEEKWPRDQDAAGHYIVNLPAPTAATNPMRRNDVVVGAGVLKSTALGGAVQIATPGTDYLAPIGTAAGNYDRVSVATTGLVTGGASTVVANVTALEALTGANYRDGSSVYVSSVASDFVYHVASSVTVDHITIASASGASGARWIRQPTPDGYWYQTGTQFYLGGSGASDEHNCTAAITPCATAGEIRRRLKLRIMPAGATQSFQINVDATFAGGDFDPIVAEIDATRNTATVVTVLGVPTVSAIGTIASRTAHSYLANQPQEICVTAYNWSTHVGKIIRKVGTTGTASVTSVVIADLGSGCARLSENNLFNATAGADFAPGDVVEELALPRVMGLQMRGSGSMLAGLLNIAPTGTFASFETSLNGTIGIFGSYIGGTGTGAVADSARGFALYGCSASRGLNGRGNYSASRTVFFNASNSIGNSTVGRNEWQASVFVNSTLALGEFMHVRFHSIGMYDMPAASTVISLAAGASTSHTDAIYGTGNSATSRIFSFINRSTVDFAAGPNTVAATTTPVVAYIANTPSPTSIAVADLPYYSDIYGNAIYIAQNSDPYKRMAVAGSDITAVTGAGSSVTGLLETGGPTHLTYGAIPTGSFMQRSGSTVIGTTTIPGASVGLTATQVGFGSVGNTLTGSAQMTFADSINPTLSLGDGSTTTTATIQLNTTGSASKTLRFQNAGTTHAFLSSSRDGTASTGRVLNTWSLAPVSGGSNHDFFKIVSSGVTDAIVGVYAPLGDVLLGGSNGGDALGTSATNGFVWLPRMGGAPSGTPDLIANFASTGSPRDRQPTVIDSTNKRFYWYDTGATAWRYASFDNGNGANAITALTGDVTATGPGSAAATIANDAVTLPKIVNFITDSFPCRDTAGTGDLEVCAVGGGIEFTGGPGIRTSAFTGDATKTAGGTVLTLATVNSNVGSFTNATITVNAKGLITAASSGSGGAVVADADYGDITVTSTGTVWNIDANAVGNAELRDSGALSLMGRNVNTGGDPADISAVAGSDCVYREGSSTIACGTVATAGIAANAVTSAKFRQSTGLSVVGNSGAGTADVTDITAGSDGQVLRRSGSSIAWGAILESSVTNLTTDLAAKAPVGATYITQTPDATLTAEQALSAQPSGMLSSVTSTGVVTATAFTSGRIAYGSGTNGTLTDTSLLNWDGTRIGVGTAAPDSSAVGHFNRSVSGAASVLVSNPSTGTGAHTSMVVGQSATAPTTTPTLGVYMFGSNFTTVGPYAANTGLIEQYGGSVAAGTGHLLFSIVQSAGDFRFITTASGTERMRIANGGNVSIANLSAGGVAYATAATGVLKIGTSAEVASAITWPATNRVLFSSGTTTAPIGRAGISVDTSDDLFVLSDFHSFVHNNLGTGESGTFEAVKAQWLSNTWTLSSSTSGGTMRAMLIKSTATTGGPGGTGGVTIDDHLSVNGFAAASNDAFGVAPNTNTNRDHVKFYVGGGAAQDTANNDLFQINPNGTTIGTGNNGGTLSTVRIKSLLYTGSGGPSVGATVSLLIDGAPTCSGIGSCSGHAMWVKGGIAQFDGTLYAQTAIIGGVGNQISFFGGGTVSQQTVTGASDHAALCSLLAALANNYNLVVNATGTCP